MDSPAKWEVWLTDFGEPIGHEAGFRRPALVVSGHPGNPHGLVTVCPCTTSLRGYPTHIEVDMREWGLAEASFIQVEQIVTVSAMRLVHRFGTLARGDAERVRRVLRYFLDV